MSTLLKCDDDEGNAFLDPSIFIDDIELARMLQHEEDSNTHTKTGDFSNRETSDTDFSDMSIQEMFVQFDKMYFHASLASVFVEWSKRMTLCAGVCVYQGRGGMCAIRLSEPLLKFRPRADLVNTLLHEMIHAYLFVTANNTDHDAHGDQFQKMMHEINKRAGTKITIFHSFVDEVEYYRTHWWQCDGPCRNSPRQGIVKRAMNRPPGPYDDWWNDHQQKCGGTFTKIREPEEYTKKKRKLEEKKGKKEVNSKQARNFINFFKKGGDETKQNIMDSNIPLNESKQMEKRDIEATGNKKKDIVVIDEGEGEEEEEEKLTKKVKRSDTIDLSISTKTTSTNTTTTTSSTIISATTNLSNILVLSKPQNSIPKIEVNKTTHETKTKPEANILDLKPKAKDEMVPCPACTLTLPISEINQHLDLCLK